MRVIQTNWDNQHSRQPYGCYRVICHRISGIRQFGRTCRNTIEVTELLTPLPSVHNPSTARQSNRRIEQNTYTRSVFVGDQA